MRYTRVSAVIAGITLLGLGSAGSAAHAEAGWIPDKFDGVVPACPEFDVRIVTDGRFKLDIDGAEIRLTGADSSSTFTNVETGASVRLATNGTFRGTVDASGTVHLSASGHLALGGPLIGLLLFNGQVELVQSPEGLLSVVGSTGRVTDICTLID